MVSTQAPRPLLSVENESPFARYLLVIGLRNDYACHGVVEEASVDFPGEHNGILRQAHGREN